MNLLMYFSFILVVSLLTGCDKKLSEEQDPLEQARLVADSTLNYLENTQPDYEVDSHVLKAEYQSNELAADNKYLNKLIVVEGFVDDIKKDMIEDGQVNVFLGADGLVPHVKCVMHFEYLPQVAKLKRLDRVKIKGICDGYQLLYPNIIKCIIIK